MAHVGSQILESGPWGTFCYDDDLSQDCLGMDIGSIQVSSKWNPEDKGPLVMKEVVLQGLQ